MKHLAWILVAGLLPNAAFAHSLGVFADPLGTNCNLVIPYPGGSVTAYVVGTIDPSAVFGIGFGSFRIEGLPGGWIGSVVASGPDVNLVLGHPFAEGAAFAYPTCVGGTRVVLVLSITPSSSVENVSLAILPHSDPVYRGCGFEGQFCTAPCPMFCACNGLGYDCRCVDSLPATINGRGCFVGTEARTWGRLKVTYR
jgi:hypothetical protein